MIVKMMSGEKLADSDPSKSYSLKETDDVTFKRGVNGLEVMLRHTLPGDNNYREVTFLAEGNVYVLNSEGKTIESIAHMPPMKTRLKIPGEGNK
jgi:hypothetical protein